MEHRQHDEVRPLVGIATIGSNGEIGIVLLIESVLGIEVAVYLLALVEYLLGLHLLLRLVDGGLPQVLVLVEVLKLVKVHLLLHLVLDHGHHAAKGVDGGTLVLGGLCALEDMTGIPDDEILFIEEVKLGFVGAIGIRIILRTAFTKGNFLDRNGETALHGQQSVLHHGLHSGTIRFITLGRVGIGKETKFGGILGQLAELLLGPGRTKGSNGIINVYPLQTHHIGSTFHTIELVLLGCLTDGHIDTEQRFGLGIDVGFRRIEILGNVIHSGNVTGCKSDNPTITVTDRNHHTSPEEVVQIAGLLVLLDKRQFLQNIGGNALFGCPSHQTIPFVGCKTDAHFLHILFAPSAHGITQGILAFSRMDALHEELGSLFIGNPHGLLLHSGTFLFRSELHLFYFDVVLLGQPSQGFGKSHRFVFHQETDSIATLVTTAEAMPGASCRCYHKTRCLLAMERTTCLVMRAFLGQRNELAHHIHDVGTVQYLFYILFFYHIIGVLNPSDNGCIVLKAEIVYPVTGQLSHHAYQTPHEERIVHGSHPIDDGEVSPMSHFVE